MIFSPTADQIKGIRFLLENPRAGIFGDPGTKKTSITLKTIELLRDAGNLARGAVVFATRRACHLVWGPEARKWGFDLRIYVATGELRKREESLRRWLGEGEVLVVNYDNLPWLLERLRKLRRGAWADFLAFDESTKMKNPSAPQRFKAMKPHIKRFPRRVILTGTPAPRDLGDLFAQIYLLDGGVALGKYITKFRNNYMMPVGYEGYSWEVEEKHEAEIYDKITHLILRLERGELPPLNSIVVPVELDERTRDAYREMKRHLRIELEGKVLSAANAGTASGKLRQITGGALYEDDGQTWTGISDDKLDALRDLVEERGRKPLMVGCEFTHEVDRVSARFKAPVLDGRTSDRVAAKITQDWNVGRIPLLAVQNSAVAHALNLQDARGADLCLYSPPWDLEVYEQLYQRLWRTGRKDPVFMYHLIAPGTYDEKVMRVLEGKGRRQKALLDALREELR